MQGMNAISAPEKIDSTAGDGKVDMNELKSKVEEGEASLKPMIEELASDGDISDADQKKIDAAGEAVADKALEKMGLNKDDLSADQKMQLAEFCENCLKKLTDDAVAKSSEVA
jgi:hypothetical protein